MVADFRSHHVIGVKANWEEKEGNSKRASSPSYSATISGFLEFSIAKNIGWRKTIFVVKASFIPSSIWEVMRPVILS